MAEVITLSDDEDVIPVMPRPSAVLKTSTSANHVDIQQGATAHISAVSKLNLDQLGLKRLSDVYNRNAVLKGLDVQSGIRTMRPAGTVLQNSIFQAQLATARALQSAKESLSSPGVNPLTPSTSRTRNNPNSLATPTVYKGHYMFEATETFEPRRSSRHNTKKIEGKFMCSYNPTKCYKLCGSVPEIINHVWSHVMNDPPGPPPTKREMREDGLLPYSMLNGAATTALSENSTQALKKLQTCQYCNLSFKTICLKALHVVKCHYEQDNIPTACNICEKDFLTPHGFEAHRRTHIPGDAPYNCQKCKYRTSVRLFFFQHFVEKHSSDSRALLCPICLYQDDLRPNIRRSKHIFVREFVNHMRQHSGGTQFRCHVCALSFPDRSLLEYHWNVDHVVLNQLWQVVERKTIHAKKRERMSKRSKIGILQRKFMATLEGYRISDEVACKGNAEREGYDLTSSGNTLFKCECGFKSWNGNRTASHFHRCRQCIQDIERHREITRFGGDTKEELALFAVYPLPTNSEAETEKSLQDAHLQRIQDDQEDPNKINTEPWDLPVIDDLPLLKQLCKRDDRSSEIIEKCLANCVTSEP